MKVLVIGASGKTGSQVVDRATAAGHEVTAFVRNPDSYHPSVSNVRVVAGDATDAGRLSEAMVGQDAVIDTIGGKTPFLESDLERNTAKSVVSAMQQCGVHRLIAVSALGVGESQSQGGFVFQHLLLPLFLRGSTRDKAQMEQVVRQSGMDFVLVRPAVLNDSPGTGSAHVVSGEEKAHKITRADVAQFLVEQLTNDAYLGQAVTIANA
jgi:putative NADH-flavin reductase